ncbi:hypothetical protein SAMN02745127_00901 [Oceanospirillum multiglobuliferum]|uniref:DUF2169 domain-containing protein n=1 Tax=Oceanospirillum multiglobuliferum TaxID=64969 RepID=A0A1T4MSV3_9GAMM|nr:DUF2169 domain-containing protein [Oceanospirillum multiglobuliferum]OPX56908.1 hypothetical protein BTE48_00275 [Oceanospirillum multiglobuliferum]SJZ69884.1 hypothetical protein SAMN02745127_00901 [Oceanospirillum multiglobuliferum]
MQLIAPPEITLQTLVYGWKGQQRLVITLMLATPLDSPQPYSTQDAWTGIAAQIPNAEVFDLGYPKPKGEVLVYGQYHAPEGFAISADQVRLKLGNVDKTLAVTGPRVWRSILAPTAPEPFSQLPLTYQYGFGGEHFANNPVGMGDPAQTDAPLPQLEYLDQLLTSKHQKPAPAGLNATNVDWLPRKNWWGTYDTAWQEQDSPFLARDLNPDFFMQAASDQWLKSYFQGGEHFELHNMHPTQRLIKGVVPAYQLRVLVQKLNQPAQLLDCVTDTLLLLPDINMQVLLARTELSINSIDGSEITLLQAAYEHQSQSRQAIEHYTAHAQLRQSDTIKDEEILDYSPLRPKGLLEPLSALKVASTAKPPVAQPGAATLAVLAAAGGFAAMAAKAAAQSKSDAEQASSAETTTADSAAASSEMVNNIPDVSEAQAQKAADAINTQFAALGLTEAELDALVQAPPEQVAILINQILAKQFPDETRPDATAVGTDPVVQAQLSQTGVLVKDSKGSIPDSDNPAVDAEVKRVHQTPDTNADIAILSPLVTQQLDRVSTELKQLYEHYPGEDKQDLTQPGNIPTQALLEAIKSLVGKT